MAKNTYQMLITPEKAARAMLFGDGIVDEIQKIYFSDKPHNQSPRLVASRKRMQMLITSDLGYTRLNVERVEGR